VEQLGVNGHGEVMEVGRGPGCYFGLLLDPAEAAGVLVVAPAALLHPSAPQPDGTVLYALLTGHPARQAHDLVVLPSLTLELHAWPHDSWSSLAPNPRTPSARSWPAGAAVSPTGCDSTDRPPRKPWRFSGQP
jgi:hypothetical protein